MYIFCVCVWGCVRACMCSLGSFTQCLVESSCPSRCKNKSMRCRQLPLTIQYTLGPCRSKSFTVAYKLSAEKENHLLGETKCLGLILFSSKKHVCEESAHSWYQYILNDYTTCCCPITKMQIWSDLSSFQPWFVWVSYFKCSKIQIIWRPKFIQMKRKDSEIVVFLSVTKT